MDISAYQHINIRMSTRGKRPLRNLTPSDKVRAIQRIHNGETKASVSRDIGVPESTLRGWCKNEQKLRFMCHQLGVDQMPVSSILENPPEKRTKFDTNGASSKFTNIPKFANFGYNRLPLNGIDFTANNALNNFNSGNAFLDNIAFEEFMKNNTLHVQAGKQTAGHSSLPSMNALSFPTADYSQLSMMQNLNLLSFLTPMADGNSAGSSDRDADIHKNKVPQRTSNSGVESTDSTQKKNVLALSVKEWAKDPSELGSAYNGISNNSRRHTNDSNNNDLQTKRTEVGLNKIPETGSSTLAHSVGIPNIPNLNIDVDGNPTNTNNDSNNNNNSTNSSTGNNAVLEWCKVFNASLNFIALAAAAAALQPTALSSQVNSNKQEDSAENILYTQLTKTAAPTFNSPTSSYIHCDASNDSYYESEPEDLSIRSTTSKLSSPTNSRSQSPTKSSASSCSAQSDVDQ